jgi:hypothetical protein
MRLVVAAVTAAVTATLLLQGHGLPASPSPREQWQACDRLAPVDRRVGCYARLMSNAASQSRP